MLAESTWRVNRWRRVRGRRVPERSEYAAGESPCAAIPHRTSTATAGPRWSESATSESTTACAVAEVDVLASLSFPVAMAYVLR
jgi:hypothetical protein